MLANLLSRAVDVAHPRCAETDPEEFFPEKGGIAYGGLKVCQRCPSLDDCREQTILIDLELYLDPHEQGTYGVQGGLTATQRRSIAQQLAHDLETGQADRGLAVEMTRTVASGGAPEDSAVPARQSDPLPEQRGPGRVVRGTADREDATGLQPAA